MDFLCHFEKVGLLAPALVIDIVKQSFLLTYWSDPKTLFVFVLHKHKFVFVFVKELFCVPKTPVIGQHNGMHD